MNRRIPMRYKPPDPGFPVTFATWQHVKLADGRVVEVLPLNSTLTTVDGVAVVEVLDGQAD